MLDQLHACTRDFAVLIPIMALILASLSRLVHQCEKECCDEVSRCHRVKDAGYSSSRRHAQAREKRRKDHGDTGRSLQHPSKPMMIQCDTQRVLSHLECLCLLHETKEVTKRCVNNVMSRTEAWLSRFDHCHAKTASCCTSKTKNPNCVHTERNLLLNHV